MKKILGKLSILVAGLIIGFDAMAQNPIPYLQSATPVSMVATWKTTTSSTPVLRYGASETELTNTITGTTKMIDDVGYVNNYFYHTVKISDLSPATKYYYRVVSDVDSSAVYSFRTLPSPGEVPNESGHLRFLILGDNQIKAQPRYDSLMVAAQRKMTELYGTNFNDSVSFILNMGDQVDVGTLDHYEHVHFKKSRYLSPYLPIYTAVGNHETYGTLKMSAYYDHFVLDSMQYKGIYSGTEDYYAFQAGNVVIAYLNTEATSTTQFNWFKKIVDTANSDTTVKWIITIGHRPYQAEQYVGDISTWIRNTVVPYAVTSPKMALHLGAHHHIYARGQMKDAPVYNVISGGTAWNQYWGMATETNFDDVQKTISQWAWQLVDIDMTNGKMDVKSYSIGSIYGTRDNMLIDSFHRYLDQAAPLQPVLSIDVADSVELPFTIDGSAFSSTTGEALNSSEFQVSLDRNFSVVALSSYRHFEDLFGNVSGFNPDTTTDQSLDVDITKFTIPVGALGNGLHYARVRYRDQNQNWSDWSAVDSFKIYNSVLIDPKITLDTNRYSNGDTVKVTFTNGSPDPGAWIGIYRKGQTPSGSSPSVKWDYTGSPNGTLNFTLSDANEYFVAYFGNSGYTEVAPRVKFYYGPDITLATTAEHYAVGSTVPIQFDNAPALPNDWIGVYKIGMTPGGPASIAWSYISVDSGVYNVSGLGKGYYFATYMLRDQYFEASPRVFFSVGDTISTLSIDNSVYDLGEYISASWYDGPGNPKDWLGVYHEGDDPNVDPLISYTYIDGQPTGSSTLPDSAMPQTPGNYFLVLFTNDSYNEVSNRVSFEMIGEPLPINLVSFTGNAEGMAHRLNWKALGEMNGGYYALQSSADGKIFSPLVQLNVELNNMGAYSYLNETPFNGDNFYRLRIVDESGAAKYSNVVRIHQNENGLNEVSLYPNPVANGSRSIVESPYPIDQIEVLNSAGQIIYQSKNINSNKFSLLHHDLPAGNYFVKIYSRKVYTAKLTVTQ